jgi:oligopeptide/dipeptide ABC transporter ATP-binding protein
MKPGLCDQERPDMHDSATRVRCFLDQAGVPENFEIKSVIPKPEAVAASSSEQAEVALVVENVSKRFTQRSGTFRRTERSTHAVSDVSFELHSGETLGLVGESGCGKSTLGQTIAGLIDPSEGRVRLSSNGNLQNISHLPEPERRKVWQDIRFVFQDPFASLNPRMTVFELISEPLRVGPLKIKDKEQMRDRVYDVMRRTGMNPDQSNRYPHAFSGGQRQRIGIARALAPKPRIVIADEPVSALDVSVQAQILNLFQDLQQEFGLTYLFISHDLNVVSNISNRVAVMYAGRIVEVAKTDEIYFAPRHPYSSALLGAVLIPEYNANKVSREPLQGQPPNPANLPSGCSFAPRCAFATDICRQVQPLLEADGEGRLTACHRKDVITLSGVKL